MADVAGDHLTAVSAMEIGSIGILTEDVVDPSGPGASAPLTVGLPRHHRQHGPERGLHVPHARDPAGIGRPLYPEGDGVNATEVWCTVTGLARTRRDAMTTSATSMSRTEACTRRHGIRYARAQLGGIRRSLPG
jgi:hypothetical protein